MQFTEKPEITFAKEERHIFVARIIVTKNHFHSPTSSFLNEKLNPQRNSMESSNLPTCEQQQQQQHQHQRKQQQQKQQRRKQQRVCNRKSEEKWKF